MKNKQVPKQKTNDELREEVEGFLTDLFFEARDAYGTGAITLELIKRDYPNPANAHDTKKENPFVISYCSTYKRATIYYFPVVFELYKHGRKDLMADAIVHEAAHVLTEKLCSLALDRHARETEIMEATEYLTESIAQIGRKILEQKDGIYKNLKKDS